MKLSEIKDRRNQIQTHIAQLIDILEDEIEKNNDDIDKLDTEINDLKMKKVVYRYKLKEMYTAIMKVPQEIR